MKLTANLALALTVTVPLAVGAVGFADKAQDLAALQTSPRTWVKPIKWTMGGRWTARIIKTASEP